MDPRKIDIVFLGTSEIALPSLEALIKNSYNITAVVTNPDEPAGRKNILTPPPVKILAQKYKIPVFQPIKLDTARWQKEIPAADLYVVAAYGKIIPKNILDIPKYGVLNLHPSLLPRWRGPSPVQYAILNGDQETGVTVIKLDELMDHGPILAKIKLPVAEGVTSPELYSKLAKLGAELLIKTIPRWIAGEIILEPQNDTQATFSKILGKDDGRINWSRPAGDIERTVRAFNLWPGTWTLWPSSDKIYRVKIAEAETTDAEPPSGSEGFVWSDKKMPILVKTGRGSLIIKKLTLEGKKTLQAGAFVRGYPKFIGSILI